MKKSFLLLLAGSLFFLVATKSVADNFQGEFCWQVFNESNDPLWQYKFGVFEKEGGYIALYGTIDFGDNGISASHGNAVFAGDSIKLTITSGDYEENFLVWAETFMAKLDRTNFDGTWNALSLEIDAGTSDVKPTFQKGTIKNITCP